MCAPSCVFQQQQGGKFYSTKYSPPKKVSKESKQLSSNIQKFLKKKEAEEAEKKREKNQKVAELMAKRDEKSKNKIRKMLKVTKSANKSVLADCDVTAEGGTRRARARAMTMATRPTRRTPCTRSTSRRCAMCRRTRALRPADLSRCATFPAPRSASRRPSTGSARRPSRTHVKGAAPAPSARAAAAPAPALPNRPPAQGRAPCGRSYSTSKTLYDPEAEKREEENKKRQAEQQNRAKLKRAAQPPPMDFQALLRLAEKKQHEPVVFAQPEKKKEPERLLSAKEKREMEERQRQKEQRAQRDKMRDSEGKPKPAAATAAAPSRMEPNGRIPKLNQAKPSPSASPNDAKAKAPSDTFKRPAPPPVKASSSSSSASSSHSPSSNRSPVASTKLVSSSTNNNKTAASVGSRPGSSGGAAAQAEKPSSSGSSAKVSPPSRNPYAAAIKNGAVREFPPRDRPAGSGSSSAPAKTRQFPPADVQRRGPADAKGRPNKPQAPAGHKRKSIQNQNLNIYPYLSLNLYPFKGRICDDDESDYDSELDDFIDDGDCEEDISLHIRNIFGYDRRRYRDQDDDDRGMESSFAQMQREEFISKKLGEYFHPRRLVPDAG